MKRLKIIAVASGILTSLHLLPALLSIVPLAGFKMTTASAGIIGSADGPTAIYVVSRFSIFAVIARRVFFAVCVLTFIVSMILLLKARKKR